MKDQHSRMQEQIINILEKRCHINVSRDDYDENIHLDSMALLELIVGLENEFRIKLDDTKLGKFYSFRSIKSISQLVAEQSLV